MANRIKEWRQSLRLTMDQLGARMGTTKQTISKLEKGERKLSQEWMDRLSVALNIKPHQLLPGSEGDLVEHAPSADDGNVVDNISSLPPQPRIGQFGAQIIHCKNLIVYLVEIGDPQSLSTLHSVAEQLARVALKEMGNSDLKKSEPSTTSAP